MFPLNYRTSPLYVHEKLLFQQLSRIFPNVQIHQNAQKEINFINPKSGKCLEFDIWIPNFNLSFEFQDAYHFISTWYYQNTKEHIANKDNTKRNVAYQEGVDLISIPCWWDGEQSSLVSTISFFRPDLEDKISNVVSPISLNPPEDYFSNSVIPEVGELMLASFPQYNFSILNPENGTWWMGEKYDGVRGCWNFKLETAFTRYGKEVNLIPSIISSFPAVILDCELWFGRGQFSTTFSLLSESHSNWPFFRTVTFDVPALEYQQEPFESRYKSLLSLVDHTHPFTVTAARVMCIQTSIRGREAVSSFIQKIIEGSGEGVILQKCGSLYDQGRSPSLLKLKSVQADQEGIVVDVDEKNVSLKLPNGNIFEIPHSSVLISTPKIGDIVTFSFETKTRREVPTNPKIFRIRNDLVWNDVINGYLRENYLNKLSQVKDAAPGDKGYWTSENVKLFLENFAKSRNMDPLVAQNWFDSFSEFHEIKDSNLILNNFKNGYFQAIETLFPGVKFDSQSIQKYQRWGKIENRRNFFENYARENKFDPLVATNWYSQPREKIASLKGAHRVMSYHGYSISKALSDLFPNIGVDRLQFVHRQMLWDEKDNRRKFFEKFAHNEGFDPLVADHWYSVPRDLLSSKAASIINYHNNSVAQALLDLFPEIGLQKSKLSLSKNFWDDVNNRRKVFEEYARKNNFDPLIVENWYRQSKSDLMQIKEISKIIVYHRNSLWQALSDLFSHINLDRSKLLSNQYIWDNPKHQRKLFEDFAKMNHFSPLSPSKWFSVTYDQIAQMKGGKRVMKNYENKVSSAILKLFPEIEVSPSQFLSITESLEDKNRRREIMEEYAKSEAFDPLVPDHWYTQSKSRLSKKLRKVISYHGHSVTRAIMELFPNIGLRRESFLSQHDQDYWSIEENRKKFFYDFSKTKNINFHSDQWYSVSRNDIMNFKGAGRIVLYHRSVAKGLCDLFPEFNFDYSRLFPLRPNSLDFPEIRRKFFEKYAFTHGFDPLNADNWYKQSMNKLTSTKGMHRVISFHENNISKTLLDLFPDIGLIKSKLVFLS